MKTLVNVEKLQNNHVNKDLCVFSLRTALNIFIQTLTLCWNFEYSNYYTCTYIQTWVTGIRVYGNYCVGPLIAPSILQLEKAYPSLSSST